MTSPLDSMAGPQKSRKMTPEELNWLRLHLTPGLGRKGIIRLVEVFGSAAAILDASPSAWIARAGIRPSVAAARHPFASPAVEQARLSLEKISARILTLWDEDLYPALLRQIPDPPAILYLRGQLAPGPSLGVVGSRKASVAGLRLTHDISSDLAARDITIVSGLARGIDTAAHEGALSGEGPTLAVLGCGIDRVYPPENTRLFHRVIESGGILSEYPPGTPPAPGHFPGRNRIISGLCQAVLIVEAAEGSGSLITAEFALEQGREVFAVPNQVYSANSGGVNRLIKEGAHVVTGVDDILPVLWPDTPTRDQRQEQDRLLERLSGEALELYKKLGHEPLHVDELARKSGLTPMELSAILLHLELQGGVEQLPGMRYMRRLRP